MTLVVGGARYARRYVISANDNELLLLNVVDPDLPGAARSTLVRLVRHDPGYFAGGQARQEVIDGEVSVGPAGIFMSGRKLAELSRVVERFERSRITQVQMPKGSKGTFLGDFGGFIIAAGAVTGTIWGATYGHDQFKSHKGVGRLLGGVGGFVMGLAAANGIAALIDSLDGSNVVYRASASAASAATADKP